MNALLLLVGVLTILSAGFGVTMLLPADEDADAAEVFALSWILGTAFVSSALALIGIFARGISLQITMTVACIFLGATGLRRLRNRPRRAAPRALTADWILRFFIAVSIVVVAVICLRSAFVWDGILIWEAKARIAFLNHGALPASYFSDGSRTWSHLDYPLLLPLTEAWIYSWLGDCDQTWIKLVSPFFYAAALAFLHTGMMRSIRSARAGSILALSFFFLPYSCFGDWGLPQGYADFPLAVAYLGAAIYLNEFLQKNSTASASRFALLSGILPWIKGEGIILWFSLLFIAALTMRRRLLNCCWIALPGLLVWLGWKVALHRLHVVTDPTFMPVTFTTLLHNVHRIPEIGLRLGAHLINWKQWSLLWCGFAAVGILFLIEKHSPHRRTLVTYFAAVGIPMFIDAGIFLFSGWPTPDQYLRHLATALPRLLFQLAPLAMLTVGPRIATAFAVGD